ncbi:cytochrome d ubiquinol oxidase subunit II [Paraburkholderia sp. CI2]|uniref:cytochrome d ubiquinol oxidase subunit II n=1 Tax=Paraburkholderia sp. CI2 TaxID=2723093 RepID=UPI001608E21D|nr:cytochrome d ubiquinol oxidase subunit II [Paraburkholderia sp. CI2]MBB5469756.1 cytochrome d ubiquinol oxidase subunit II [Paraburkholderia sp. CI2]
MLEWLWLLAFIFALVAYVSLDGFDLGVGVLSGFAKKRALRDQMLASIAPVWDGNGTWLVIAGTTLFGAFPAVYSIMLPALYGPLAGMLTGLIMRGVAIEFSHKAERSRWVWDAMLFAGSLLAAFMQGVSVGTYAQGIPVMNLRYTGSSLEWCDAFPLWCGVALSLGYATLGAGWLVLKGDRTLQEFGRAAARRLMPLVIVAATSVVVLTLVMHGGVRARWFAHPVLFFLPVLALLAFCAAGWAARHGSPKLPYLYTAASFVLLLLALVGSYLPYIIPFQVTLSDAAAPPASQAFMFWGAGLFVLPLIVLYTCVAYSVFRGEVSKDQAYH